MIKDIADRVNEAHERISQHIIKTRLLHSPELSDLVSGNVYLKLESEQHTGSFKARGSLNKVLASFPTERTFITASTGNHGAGFGRAMEITGQKGIVFLPTTASPIKLKKIKKYPVELRMEGDNPLYTELYAKAYAKKQEAIYVSPYNDLDIIAGQGTIAVELTSQLEHIDDVLVTIGGGGLIAGIGAYLKSLSTSVNVIGCEPRNSMEMALSLQASQIVDQEDAKDTLSDGSAGGIEPGAITFPICQAVVDRTIAVEESAIKDGIKSAHDELDITIEGAAAVTIAALKKEKEKFKDRTVVLIICGGNIDPSLYQSLVS